MEIQTHYSDVWITSRAANTGADYLPLSNVRFMRPWQPFVTGVLIGAILTLRVWYWIFPA